MFGNHLYNSSKFADFQGLSIHKIKAILTLGSKCKHRHFVLLRLQVISFPSIRIITLRRTFDRKHFRLWEFKKIVFTYFECYFSAMKIQSNPFALYPKERNWIQAQNWGVSFLNFDCTSRIVWLLLKLTLLLVQRPKHSFFSKSLMKCKGNIL